MTEEFKVSLSELLDVRDAGFEVLELLDITLMATEHLSKKRPTPNSRGFVFGIDNINLLKNGSIEIDLIAAIQADDDIIPPEMKSLANPGRVVGANTDAAFVWCLGTSMMKSGAAECTDADLYSLINLLTVEDVTTRPTLKKLAQMVRNKLPRGRNVKNNLQELYMEIMGDEDELDELSDVSDITESDLYSDREENFEDDDNDSMTAPFEYKEDVIKKKTKSNEVVETVTKSATVVAVTKSDKNPFDDDFVTTSDKPSAHKEVKDRNLNLSMDPFEFSESEPSHESHFQTLSGRDPFGDIERISSVIDESKNVPTINKTANNNVLRSITNRRLSEDDDIVQAEFITDTPSPVSNPFSTIDDLGYHSQKSNTESQMFTQFESQDQVDFSSSSKHESLLSPIRLKSTIHEQDSNPFNDDAKQSQFNQQMEVQPVPAKRTAVASRTQMYEEEKNDDDLSISDASSYKKQSLEPPPVSARTRSADFYKSQHVEAEVVIKENTFINNNHPTGMHKGRQTSNSRRETDQEEESIDDAFAKHLQKPFTNTTKLYNEPQDTFEVTPTTNSGLNTFQRRNSMALASIRRYNNKSDTTNVMGYGSMRKKLKKTAAVPEFVEKTSEQHIHLTAPMIKKKRLINLHRVEQSEVKVKLLNGQFVEINCRTDIKCQEIFDLVASHVNINENMFFGLAITRDTEYYFIDPEKRIEKYAPPGWKSASKVAMRSSYVLHMRIKLYPPMLNYIKTDVTMHELYLQLRRDILNEKLQTKQRIVFQLGALALQAEFSDRPDSSVSSPTDYFLLDHYLPKKCFAYGDSKKISSQLSGLHEDNKGIKSREAEMRFIKICQAQPEYGAHFHRVFKSKPTIERMANPSMGDNDLNGVQYLAIMPKGIGIYEIISGERNMIQEFLWKDTNTLQFDRKRFVIVKSNPTGAQHFIFYTDHYTKSSYFVRFAAVQHRFIIKVRQWQSTLSRRSSERPGENAIDVIQSNKDKENSEFRQNKNFDKPLQIETSKNMTRPMQQLDQTDFNRIKEATDVFPIATSASRNVSQLNETPYMAGRSNSELYESFDKFEKNAFPTTVMPIPNNIHPEEQDKESINGLNTTVVSLEMELKKDSKLSLGLTLVDGKLNGVKGVYVKNVVFRGAGEIAGILVGDRLMSVNGVDLDGKDRHDAVNLVKESGNIVRIGVLRFENISNKLPKGNTLGRAVRKDSNLDGLSLNSSIVRKQSNLSTPFENTKDSKTPPAKKKFNAGAPTLQKRARAVSDFGAKGDTLPLFNSENIIADMHKNNKIASRLDITMDSSDEELDTGQYNVEISAMYKYRGSDNEDDFNTNGFDPLRQNAPTYNGIYNKNRKTNHNDNLDTMSWASGHMSRGTTNSAPQLGNSSNVRERLQKSVDDVDDTISSKSDKIGEMTFHITRSEAGSFGLQVATGLDGAYIKQVNSEPALSSGIQANDKLISINKVKVQGMTHATIVGILKNSDPTVAIKIYRDSVLEEEDKIITTNLNNGLGSPLGLSLVRKIGSDGVYIRRISEGSVADNDKTLHVGDRIWQIDNHLITDETPNAVEDMLKRSSEYIKISVKRKSN